MILYLLVVALVAHSDVSPDTTKTLTSQLHEFQLNNSGGVMSALDMMPKVFLNAPRKYKPDESFEIGNLRYKCQNYGVYTIEGCKRKDGTEMKLGESVVIDNVKHQCLGMGSSVFYKETTCGVMGQPECDKIPLPKGFEEAMKRNGGKTETQGETSVDGVNLPKGWSLVDGGKKQITGTNASVVTHILMFNPTQTRVRRDGFNGKGVGKGTLEKVPEPAGKTNLEKFDEGLESDKKEYVQKRAEIAPIPSNSTDNLTEEDMKMMDQFNKTMEADEEMQRSNETVLGIDTFGAQGI
ncbi:hypothetical protein GCK72_013049 [Caenorhabditis remanei]|uniref:Abnormal cell migration protein 18-like fibronectin type I domain-containing protein n=1 Tax=Caenorhabditis remanei TaxID=31234 RepID=A0A6A5GPZ3_CAERE|nr:hypothetical protein GCK72_013049 [Caenorhabditis remanei]KAF1756596.1 hypothetical protein GCK72_013049 [Caenorhabditis remanei]